MMRSTLHEAVALCGYEGNINEIGFSSARIYEGFRNVPNDILPPLR